MGNSLTDLRTHRLTHTRSTSSIVTWPRETHSGFHPAFIQHNMSIQINAASIAGLSLHDPTRFRVQYSQTLHRLRLAQHWNILKGSNLLELGCGQGDCTTVLAYAAGELGSVVAIDPAELEYGASFCSLLCCPFRERTQGN
jgi:predicted methyltransferase